MEARRAQLLFKGVGHRADDRHGAVTAGITVCFPTGGVGKSTNLSIGLSLVALLVVAISPSSGLAKRGE